MKTPSFWYKVGSLRSRLLSPFGRVYSTGVAVRRVQAAPYKAKVPVICIGNVTAGGAGKTPTAIAVAVTLRTSGANPVFVTRGYGGKLSGPLCVDAAKHTAADVGDEALLLARAAPTFVAADRVAAIKMAEKHGTHIILDDGLQNPNVLPDLSFMVVDGAVGIGNGRIIPAGPLREKLSDALERVQAVVMVGDDKTNLADDITVPVLHAYLDAVLPSGFPLSASFLAFAGIGRPEKFYETCRRTGLTLVKTRDFPDHHLFTDTDLLALEKDARDLDARLLTTEKDWVRLPPSLQNSVVTLPVKMVFSLPGALQEILQEILDRTA